MSSKRYTEEFKIEAVKQITEKPSGRISGARRPSEMLAVPSRSPMSCAAATLGRLDTLGHYVIDDLGDGDAIEHAASATHGVARGAQLVRDGRDKVVLRRARPLGCLNFLRRGARFSAMAGKRRGVLISAP